MPTKKIPPSPSPPSSRSAQFRSSSFPLIGHWLHLSDHEPTASGPASASTTPPKSPPREILYSDAAGKVAVLAKTARNAMIGFVVLGYAIHWARKEKTQASAIKPHSSGTSFRNSSSASCSSPPRHYAVFNKEQLTSLANLSRWAFLLTFAGVGLRTNIGDMRKQGLRPFP